MIVRHSGRAIAVIAILSLSMTARAQVAFDHMRADGRDVRKTVIADGVYQFTTMRDSYVRQLNTVVVVTDRDVLVFDTQTRLSDARYILGEIRRITSKPVRYVVNSHGHPDHWSGNQVFVDAFPDADVIATRQTAEFNHRMADVWLPRFTTELASRRTALAEEIRTGKRTDGSVATPEQLAQDKSDVEDYASFTDETREVRRVFPTITFTDTLTLFHGGRELRFMGVTGDAEGTTVLYLPKERILITGDAVSYPIPFSNARLDRHAATLRLFEGLDVDVIVPGHGPAFHDKKFLSLERRLIESIWDGIVKAQASGITSIDELQRVVTVDELREDFAHGDSDLDARYRQRVQALIALAAPVAAKR
jgi:cyclase